MMILFLICALVSLLVLLITFLPQSTYDNNMIFAVKLPKEAAKDEEIERIRAEFKKDFRNYMILFTVLLAPLFIPSESFQALYFLLWICVAMTAIVIPFRRAHRETLQLKRKKDWFVGPKRVVQTDLRASALKNERAAPLWLFLLPAALSAFFAYLMERNDLLPLGIVSVIIVLLFGLAATLFRKAKTKVYSQNSVTNVSLNQAYRRIWSYAMLWLAFVEAIHFGLIGLSVAGSSELLEGFWITSTTMFTAIPLAIILYANHRMKRKIREATASEEEVVYSDDDEYWGNGFTYHNPNDRRVFVEKRVGIGLTVNTGTPAGKIFMGGTLALVVAVLVFVGFMIIRSELTSPVLTVTEEQRVAIDYPMYSFDFPVEDIEEIALVEEMPSGTRTNGEATGKYARGNFYLKEGIGRSRLYVFKNNPPYIRMKLEDVTIFYNEKDPEQTVQIYEQLQKLVQKDSTP